MKNLYVDNIKLIHKLKNELDTLENDIKIGSLSVSGEALKRKHNLEDEIELIESEVAEYTAEKHSALILIILRS